MGTMKELHYLTEKFGVKPDKKGKISISECNRTILAKTLAELGYKVGVEVGVAQGYYANCILQNNPQLERLFLVDIWASYPGYNMYGNKIRAYERLCRKLLEPFKKKVRYIKKFSMDAVDMFPDNSLDFVFIDGAHDFRHIAEDISEWSKKVRVGGLVYGHDFKRTWWKNSDVKDVVMSYVYTKGIKPWFEFGNGIRDPFFEKDNACWGFIRQVTDWIEPRRKDVVFV